SLSRAQPGEQALQGRRFAPLVVEGEIEEFVERVVRCVAEPREEALAAARACQHARIERKRRFLCPFAKALELCQRLCKARVALRFRPQRRAQRAVALPSELEQ